MPLSRRTFLARAGGVVAGFTLVPLAGCDFNTVTPRTGGLEVPFLTPTDAFFVKHGGQGAPSLPGWLMPDLEAAAYALRLEGLLATPTTLRLADLEAEPAQTVVKTIRCIVDSNAYPGLIGTALWQGVPLRLFLDRAGLDRSRARRLRLYGADGFAGNLRVEDVYRDFGPGTFPPLLATRMNGAPLPRAHGRPVRLLVYDRYGYKNVKWLTRVEAVESDAPFGTYQQDYGYVDDGVIRPASKVATPAFGAQVPAGSVRVAGFAVSGQAAVARVELRVDDGPWQQVRLVPLSALTAEAPALAQARQVAEGAFPAPGVWVQWDYRWTATPGTHTLGLRAHDAAGNTQPEVDRTFDDGFNPVVAVEVVVTP